MFKNLPTVLLSLFLCSCGKHQTPPEQRADAFLSVLEQNQPVVLRNWTVRDFTDASAVKGEATNSFDLQYLVNYIKENNLPSEDVFELERIDARKEDELAQFFPMVLANMSTNYPVFGYDVQYYRDQGVCDNIYTYITLVWNANFITKYKNLKRVEVEKNLTLIKQRINKEQLTITAVGLFYQITSKQKEIEVQMRGIELKKNEVQHVRNSVASSYYSSVDLETASIQLVQSEMALREAKRDLLMLRVSLKTILELQAEPECVAPSQDALAPLPPLEASLEKAMANNTRLKLARLAAKSLREAEEAIKYERFTDFNIYFGLPQLDLRRRDGESSGSLTVGFYWSVPLFDAGQEAYKYKEISIQKRKMAHQVYKELDVVEQNIRKQYQECEYLTQRIHDTTLLLRIMKTKHEFLMNLSKAGQAKYSDILKSEIELMQKETEIFNLECKLAYGRLCLDIFSGVLPL